MYRGETGSVLWCEAEAAQAVNLERARAWGLPLERILTPLEDPLQDVKLDDPSHQAAILQLARRPDVRFVVVDSLRGAHRRDENSSETIAIVMWLAELARDAGKPVWLTHHLRKKGLSDPADGSITLDRLRGSSAIVQPTRVIWALDTPDPNNRERKRLSVIKNNLARFPEPIGLVVSESGVTFGDAPEPPRTESQLDRAIDLLQALLAKEPMRSTALKEEAEGAGISWDTMKRAKTKLGVVAVRKAEGWYWSLLARDTP
jgi:hypothetical protein